MRALNEPNPSWRELSVHKQPHGLSVGHTTPTGSIKTRKPLRVLRFQPAICAQNSAGDDRDVVLVVPAAGGEADVGASTLQPSPGVNQDHLACPPRASTLTAFAPSPSASHRLL